MSGGISVQRTNSSDDQMGQIKLVTKTLSNIFWQLPESYVHENCGITGKSGDSEPHCTQSCVAAGCEPGDLWCTTQITAPHPVKGKKLVDHLAYLPDRLQPSLLLLCLVFGPSLTSHVLRGILRSFILHHVC